MEHQKKQLIKILLPVLLGAILLARLLGGGGFSFTQDALPIPEESETNAESETAWESEDLFEEGTVLDGNQPETMTVTFLDVGQGNAVLVQQGEATMLIDGGNRNHSSFVVSYLQSLGIKELAYVISSHYDADHLNGIVGALHVFPCQQILSADYETDTRVYQSYLSVVREKGIPEHHPVMGESYPFGTASFTVVCPDAFTHEDDNDNSIGIRLVYENTSFLICGDASEKMEKQMINSGLVLDSDVYLASHHGSAYSSSIEFLNQVKPEYVVISAGMGNDYGHPAKSALERIQTAGCQLLRTDLQGTLVAVSDGSSLSWNVTPCNDFREGSLFPGTEE